MKNSLFIILLLIFVACNNKNQQESKKEISQEYINDVNLIEEEEIDEEILEALHLSNRIYNLREQIDTTHAIKALQVYILDDDYFDRATANVSYPYILYDTPQNRKIEDTFTLSFENGESLTFRDLSYDRYSEENEKLLMIKSLLYEPGSEIVRTYHYIGYLTTMQKYLVRATFFDTDSYCLLVDKRDGTLTLLPGLPFFNEAGTRMLVLHEHEFEGQHEITYYVYDKKGNDPELTYFFKSELIKIENIYWVNDDCIDIKCFVEFEGKKYQSNKRIFLRTEEKQQSLPDHWYGTYFTAVLKESYTRVLVEVEYTFVISENNIEVTTFWTDDNATSTNLYWGILDYTDLLHAFLSGNNIEPLTFKYKWDKYFVASIGDEGSEYFTMLEKLE
ncbi:MAG: hypothetical protein LUE98_06745 [Tannerellaceae bacterium]|nr:hypothetical protein [Tannerellaceae bacterium]